MLEGFIRGAARTLHFFRKKFQKEILKIFKDFFFYWKK